MKHARGLTALATALLLLGLSATPSPAEAARKPAAAKQEALYPNATRHEPKLDLSSAKDQKALNDGLDAVNDGDKAKAVELLQPLIEHSKSKYAQALALQGLANLEYNEGNLDEAISNLQRALDIGVMPNDTYYQLLYMLVQFRMANEQYAEAAETLAKWRTEGKRETPESYALEGNIDYRLEKYPEAIVALTKAKSMATKPEPSWDQLLMASYAESGQSDKAAEYAQKQLAENPNDPSALNNAISVLMQAEKYPEAIKLLEQARAGGSLAKGEQYTSLAKLYLITGQDSDNPVPNATKAAGVLEDGLAKGVLSADADTYVLLGKSWQMADKWDKAGSYYQKAVPLAKDGEPALLASSVLLTDSKFSQAKAMAQQAISKGLPHPGRAYMILAEAERNLKNNSAAVAAMQKATQDPDTAEKARAWLKKTGSQ